MTDYKQFETITAIKTLSSFAMARVFSRKQNLLIILTLQINHAQPVFAQIFLFHKKYENCIKIA